ncbi:DUF6461 domain-containing protein [Streptomyces sp. 058-1L]|uniref:DUF6461 domain-containing protein n=1 Tax=Streptomyces sp. 058-1L TaxID=2789266 RepID=UPI00397FF354
MNGVCINFTRRVTPEYILSSFGASAASLEELTLERAPEALGLPSDHSLVRAGTFGDWGFCIETFGTIAVRRDVLEGLSSESHSITASCGANALHVIANWQNGEEVETFQPGHRPSLSAKSLHPLWDETEMVSSRYPGVSAIVAAFSAITEKTGVRIPFGLAAGPLLSGIAPMRDFSSCAPPVQKWESGARTLGKQLPGLQFPLASD